MSEFVLISPQPGEFGDVALALLTLAGAERAGDVRTTSDGVYGLGFWIPADLHELWLGLITSGDVPAEDEVRTKRAYNRRAKPVAEVVAEELASEPVTDEGEPTDD
jgi:hypothetical protein